MSCVVFTQVVALVRAGLLASLLFFALHLSSAMAPHLTRIELDLVTESVAKGKEADDILALVVAGRRKTKTTPPNQGRAACMSWKTTKSSLTFFARSINEKPDMSGSMTSMPVFMVSLKN